VSSGDGHQQCLGGAFDEVAPARAPVEIGGGQPQAASAPEAADGWCDQSEAQRRQQPFRGNFPGLPEWASDVLVVDESIDERDPAAEPRG
jgi:hypothetical protein